MAYTVSSLLLTAAVLAVSAIVFLYNAKKNVLPAANVGGADLFTMMFVENRSRWSDPVVAGAGWLCISMVVGFGLPVLSGNGPFVLAPSQLVATINYCLVVPLLVGSYVFLLRSLGHFGAKRVRHGETPLRSKAWFWIFQCTLGSLTLLIQWLAIRSEIDIPSLCSPWINLSPNFKTGCDPNSVDASTLSLAGVVYYSLRGLDTFMALGLTAMIGTTWFDLHKHFGHASLVDFGFPGLGPSMAITNVGTGLVACLFFGSFVTALHGLALFSHARSLSTLKIGSEADQVALFTESTWAIWAVLLIVTSGFIAAILIWLRERIAQRLLTLHEEELEALTKFNATLRPKPIRLSHAKDFGEVAERYLTVRALLSVEFSKAHKWPLPAGALVAIGASFVTQIANVSAAVLTFIMK